MIKTDCTDRSRTNENHYSRNAGTGIEALCGDPADFADELRLAAALFWYAKGEISQERAAQIAGLDRTDFLLVLSREKIEIFQNDFADQSNEGSGG